MASTARQPEEEPPQEIVASGLIQGDRNVVVHEYIQSSLSNALSEKRSYTEKLEDAQGDDIFKYLLLINRSALDAYIAQARLQSEQSFTLSRRLALGGFVLLSLSIVLGVVASITGNVRLDAAYLAAIAGALTQFISGVMFYMYNRTLQQLNRFHDKMVPSEHISMAFLANSQIGATERDSYRAQLAKSLMDQSASKI